VSPPGATPTIGTADLVQDLLRPAAYPWRPPTVDLITTHISWVFLAGDRVVKVKRPVAFGFVDHSTRERRHQSCQDEVRLNRRLTSNLYLGVVPIVRGEDGLRVDGSGPPVEWATLMRRLPATGMLDTLLAAGTAPADLAERLATRLLPFHRDGAGDCGATGWGAPAATFRVLTDNLDELRPFAGAVLAPGQLALVEQALRTFLADHRARLSERAATGWVRDGHGDLRAEHVCFEPDGTLQIFDCLEFNPAFRCADIASDLAFLLMDLERLGATAVAAALLARYRAAGVLLPDDLVRLYRAHRALVRAKVACLSIPSIGTGTGPGRDSQPSDRVDEAVTYVDLATAAALTIRPVLLVMTGLSGTGKSTVAQRLARALGASLLASDRVRKDLAGVAGAAPAAWGEGLYDARWTEATYRALFARAATALAAGQPVVLDATFLAPTQRQGAAAVAARAGGPLLLVETICDEATVAARLAARAARGDSPSDATLTTYQRQRAALAASPPPVPPGAVTVQVDTSAAGLITLDPVLAALVGAGVLHPSVPAHDADARDPAR